MRLLPQKIAENAKKRKICALQSADIFLSKTPAVAPVDARAGSEGPSVDPRRRCASPFDRFLGRCCCVSSGSAVHGLPGGYALVFCRRASTSSVIGPHKPGSTGWTLARGTC